MTILIAIDDTDTKESRGTGKLARAIAERLNPYGIITGVTRHQLLVHPDIPYTSHNSCAVIHLDTRNGVRIPDLVQQVSGLMLDDFIPGSDPGLAVESLDRIRPEVVAFGQEAKQRVLSRKDATNLAKLNSISLIGLGGTENGVIGALAGLGLAASGNDGRYVLKGRLREHMREATVECLLSAGVDEVRTVGGETIESGTILLKKFPKPSRRNHRALLFVEEGNGCYYDVVRD